MIADRYLGGSVESQRDFLEALSDSERRRNLDRQSYRMPPIANSFALGYTYYDVLDADQEGSSPRPLLLTCRANSTESSLANS